MPTRNRQDRPVSEDEDGDLVGRDVHPDEMLDSVAAIGPVLAGSLTQQRPGVSPVERKVPIPVGDGEKWRDERLGQDRDLVPAFIQQEISVQCPIILAVHDRDSDDRTVPVQGILAVTDDDRPPVREMEGITCLLSIFQQRIDPFHIVTRIQHVHDGLDCDDGFVQVVQPSFQVLVGGLQRIDLLVDIEQVIHERPLATDGGDEQERQDQAGQQPRM